MQTQFIKRVCDNPKCGKETIIPLGRGLKPGEEAELAAWVILTKEHALVSGEAPQPLTLQGCCYSCGVEILRNQMLELPSKYSIHQPSKEAPAAN